MVASATASINLRVKCTDWHATALRELTRNRSHTLCPDRQHEWQLPDLHPHVYCSQVYSSRSTAQVLGTSGTRHIKQHASPRTCPTAFAYQIGESCVLRALPASWRDVPGPGVVSQGSCMGSKSDARVRPATLGARAGG